MADYAISNVPRRVVFAASGVGPYAFTFEILAQTDIAVYKDDTLLTLTTDYTVVINTNGTGSITLTSAPTGATQIAIVGARAIQRTTDFTTGGDFFANTVNDELDSLTIFSQQNAEAVSRALVAPQTDPTTINMILPRKADRAGKYLVFDANGNPAPGEIPEDVATVAANIAAINTVADNDTNITTVATNIANVNAVVGNATNINIVATNIADVNTVAGIAADVSAVAGNSTNINAVVGNATNINAVNANSTNINTVAADSAAINTAATNIAAIIAAPTEASNAAASAADAQTARDDVFALAQTVGATIADYGFINTSPISTSDYGAL